MATLAPPETRFTADEYLALVDRGDLCPDDRVELLEGVIVAMPPSGPLHSSIVNRIQYRLYDELHGRAEVRGQSPLRAGAWSVPEPDVAVVPGPAAEYERAHPHQALLLVEVAESSLPQDRLSKSRIYAAAGVPEYWIINLREGVIEVLRSPDRRLAVYADRLTIRRGQSIALVAFPDISIPADDLLPHDRSAG